MTPPDAGRAPRKDLLAFDRSDRWGLVGLLVLMVGGALVAWVVGPLLAWARGEAIRLEMFSEVSVPALDEIGVGHGPGTYDVYLADPSTAQRLVALVPGLLWLVLVVTGSILVVRIMRTIAADDPFERRNVLRLRLLAGLLVLGAPVAGVIESLVRGVLVAQLDTGTLSLGSAIAIPWLALVGGMVVALLAEAFKAGSRLREDVEGLV